MYICAINLAKAYDSAIWEILLKKVICIQNWFHKVNYWVEMWNIQSKVVAYLVLVLLRWDFLSLLLFIFYIHELISHFGESCALFIYGESEHILPPVR